MRRTCGTGMSAHLAGTASADGGAGLGVRPSLYSHKFYPDAVAGAARRRPPGSASLRHDGRSRVADRLVAGRSVIFAAEVASWRAPQRKASIHGSLMSLPRVSPKSSRPHASCSAIRYGVSRSWLSSSARAQPARVLAPVVDPAMHDLGRQGSLRLQR